MHMVFHVQVDTHIELIFVLFRSISRTSFCGRSSSYFLSSCTMSTSRPDSSRLTHCTVCTLDIFYSDNLQEIRFYKETRLQIEQQVYTEIHLVSGL